MVRTQLAEEITLMRMVWLALAGTFLVLFVPQRIPASHATCAEAFNFLLDMMRIDTEWNRLYRKVSIPTWLDVVNYGAIVHPQTATVSDPLGQLHHAFAESRAIVTRKRNAKTLTWDGRTPAFVVDPAIWYLDPEVRMHKTWSWPIDATDLYSSLHRKDSNRRTLLDPIVEKRSGAPRSWEPSPY